MFWLLPVIGRSQGLPPPALGGGALRNAPAAAGAAPGAPGLEPADAADAAAAWAGAGAWPPGASPPSYFSLSRLCMPSFCLRFLAMRKKIRPAMASTPAMTPTAMPAFAPADMPPLVSDVEVSLAVGARVPAAFVTSGAGVVATRLVVSGATVLDKVSDGVEELDVVEVLLLVLDELVDVDVDLVKVVFSSIVEVLVLYPATLPENVGSSVRYLVRITVLGPIPELAVTDW